MKDKFAKNKYLFYRGWTYINIIGIGFLVGNNIKDYLGTSFSWILFAIIGMTLIWGVGYIESRLELFASEQKYIMEKNPIFLDTLKEVNTKLDDIKEKLK